MIKIIGACFIILASSWIGFEIARSYRERPQQIRQLRSALSLLETEIGYGVRPLAAACKQIALRTQGFVSTLFARCEENLNRMDGASTYQCFKQAIDHEWKNTAMKEPEKRILLDLSATLGISDRENQLHHLAMAKTNLEIEEKKARDEQMQYEKMFKTIGVLAGTLIVLLIY